MLAGCSSALLSPRHRLRSEASTQFQACYLPSMSTQRLDLPCPYVRKDAPRLQPVRPIGLSIDAAPIEVRTAGCSLRQSIKLPAENRRGKKNELCEKTRRLKKRYAEEVESDEESCLSRVKRKRGEVKFQTMREDEKDLIFGQLGGDNFWCAPSLITSEPVPLIAALNAPQLPFSLPNSGEEERISFVPNDLLPPSMPPLSSLPWFDSVVITHLGEDKNVVPSQGLVKEASGSSSTSSGSQELGIQEDREAGNGSNPPNPGGSSEAVATRQDRANNCSENDCIELVSLVVACVEQIDFKNIAAINHCLARLGELASPVGRSPMHRLIAYFTEALALRVAMQWPQIFHITGSSREVERGDEQSALILLNHVSPIPKFVQFTSNEILLRTFEGKDRVHIIDFDIKQGMQWPGLFQSLASRTNPPSHVRITGVGNSKQELLETGDRLAGFAEALNLPFEFHPVADRLEDVRLWMLRIKEKETVAVNCIFQVHKMLYDSTEGAPLRDFLRLIRSTNSAVVVIAEQEAAHNEPSLDTRLSNSLKYYSAIFDSIDASLPMDSPTRIKIEEAYGSEIRNIIACEGRNRLERHEKFDKWQQLMKQGGFQCMGINERELLQSQMLLKMYTSENYQVERNHQGDATSLTLSWLDQPLYSVSAWTSGDFASSSTSYPHPN